MPRDGRFVELVGHYDPLPHPAKVVLDEERVLHWLKTGAVPTPTVRNLLHKKGILLRWDMEQRGVSPEQQKEAIQKFEVIQLERDRRLGQQSQKQKAAAPAVEEPAPESAAPAEAADAAAGAGEDAPES